jgi:hypothetical protein
VANIFHGQRNLAKPDNAAAFDAIVLGTATDTLPQLMTSLALQVSASLVSSS